MNREQFLVPGSILIERQVHREGPSPVFIAWKPHTSQSFVDEKELLKFAAWPKSTPTGAKLREWLRSFDGDTLPEPEHNAAKIKEVSWGPEAHEVEPNDATKTII
jgi:hypothetical protein